MDNITNLTTTDPSSLPFNVGKFIATVFITFITSNIDDLVILMNFFTVATLSLAGFALAFAVPVEFLGFLGFLPIFLGVKGIFEIICKNNAQDDLPNILPMYEISTVELQSVRPRNSTTNDQDDNNRRETVENRESPQKRILNTLKRSILSLQILKVSSITLANGSDNIAIYSALFAQARKWQVGVYIASYLLLMLVMLLICYFFINFRPILAVAQKYAHYIVPFAFIGIGIYIVVTSDCFPWLSRAIKTKNFRNG